MVFSNFTRTVSGNQIIFKNEIPIESVTLLKFYKDNAAGIFLKKELRWSFNNSYWSSWSTLNQGNLTNIDIKDNKYLFIEIRYVISGSATVTTFYINYTSTVTPTVTPITISPTTVEQQAAADLITPIPSVVGTGKVFSNFTRTVSGNQIIFKNIAPIRNVEYLKFYKDNASGTFLKKELRWSFNNSYWSSWTDLNQGNLTNIDIKGNVYLYIEVRYIISGSATVTTFYINYTTISTQEICETVVTPTEIITTKIINVYDDVYDDTCDVEKTVLLNADLLNNHPGSYYLWRPNQKGEQSIATITGLQDILNYISKWGYLSGIQVENISGDGIGVFYQRDGSIFYLKRIKGENFITVTESSGIITISSPYCFIKDTSLGSDFVWDGGILDVSGLDEKLDEIQNIDYPGDASIFSYENSNVAYFKKLIGGISTQIIQDVSTITINVDPSVILKYEGTFEADGSTSMYIPVDIHGLGTGPLNISIYEGTDRVFTGIDISNGNITFEWLPGALSGTCEFIIVGGTGDDEVDPNLDYTTYQPFIGDVSFLYTGDLVTQIVTKNTIGTKIVDFTYDLNDDVSIIDINNYGKANRQVTFEKDVDENIIAVHII